jgi:hypothetical protein
MSVEINNESGTPVDERALAALARFVLDRMDIHPLAELSVDGRAWAHRCPRLPDGRVAAARR